MKMKNMIGSFTAKVAALLLAFGCAGGAWGATTVAKIGDTEYRSLQDAVNRVADGQTISLVADCDETALVARVVTFTITPDAGVNFTGSVAKGSDETSIATASDGNGGTAYTVTLPRKTFANNTTGDAELQAYIKKYWEKAQSGVFIAGRKIAKTGTYDGQGYPDAAGKVTVDLENHTITLNDATIEVSSSAVSTYTKSFPGTSWPDLAGVIHNEVPYDGVVCISTPTYKTVGSGAGRTNSDGRYHQPQGYGATSIGCFATAGIAILDDNAWTVTLIGESGINVNAAFSYPSSGSYMTAGDAYGIYAKGNLTVVKGNGESAGNLVANIVNTGTGNYQSANYYPGNSAICSMGNLTISEGTAVSATLEGTMTMTVSGTEITSKSFAKYGAIYAATNVVINGATVAATNKLVSSIAGYGMGVSAIGSQYGNITIDGGAVNAVCPGENTVSYNGQTQTTCLGQGISTYGEYGAYTKVEIKGGADVNVEAGRIGIAGEGGVTISGTTTEIDVDVKADDGRGIAASSGPYQISEATVKVDAAVAVVQNSQTGNSISTGDYSSSVPANAVAEGTYQYFGNGSYHLTDTIPQGWIAFYDGTFYMDEGSSAEAISLCAVGGSVYINEDSSAAKTGIGEGQNFTIYVLQGKSYSGAVTSARLQSTATTGEAVEFDGKTYIPVTYTMSVDSAAAIAKIVKANGTETYYASMTTTYSSPKYNGAVNYLAAGDTLVILEDVTLTSGIGSKNFNWTLDLNGHKITAGNNYKITVPKNYTLTIKDSSQAQTGEIFYNGTVPSSSAAYTGVTANGTVNVEGGRFSGGNSPLNAGNNGAVNIYGGFFDGPFWYKSGSTGPYLFYGGTYTADPTAYVADGYAAKEVESGKWVVGRLDFSSEVVSQGEMNAEYRVSASIYDSADSLIAKLAENQTIAIGVDTANDVGGMTLAKVKVADVVASALLKATDSSKITAIALSVQSAMTNTVTTAQGYQVYFDVKPVAVITSTGMANETFTVANSSLADDATFAFDLALPALDGVAAGSVLIVTHISDGYNNETTYDFAKTNPNDGLYVSATATHFSTFRVNYHTQSTTAKLLTVSGNADFITTSYLETDLATAVSKVGQKGTVGKVVLLDDFTLDAPVSVTKPVADETVVDLNGHTITLADGVENAFVLSGDGTKLSIKDGDSAGTAPVGITGYPANYMLSSKTADGATTYTAAPAPVKVSNASGDVVGFSMSISNALEIASTGYTITLATNVDENVTLKNWTNNAITIDLGGYTLTGQILAPYGAKTEGIVIRNGSIVGRDASSFYCLQFGSGSGNATLENLSITQVSTNYRSYALFMQQSNKSVTLRNVTLDGRFYTANSGSVIAIESGVYKNSTGLASATISNHGVVSATGGTFYYDPTTPNNLVAKGYVATETTDANDVQCWVIELGPAFAKVTLADGTETEYWDLDEAISALAEGATLTIKPGTYDLANANYSLPKNVTIVGVEENGARVTITSKPTFNSANGLTIENIDFDGGYAWQPSAVTVHGDATFKNCNITCNENAVYYSTVNGTLTFDGCTITAGTYALNVGEGTGDVIVKDCTISGWTSFGNTGKVTITDTTFDEGAYNYVRFYQDAVISNCTFNSEMGININETGKKLIVIDSAFEDGSSVASVVSEGENDDPIANNYVAVGTEVELDENGDIVGGTFDTVADELIADWYVATDVEGGKKQVGKLYVAQIGGTKYETFADAIAAVEDGETIKLLTDSNVVTYYGKNIGDSGYAETAGNNRLVIDNGKTFTLDLGGHVLSGRINFTHGNMTLTNGTVRASSQALNIYGTKDYAYAGQEYSVITVAADVTVEANYALCVFAGDPNYTYYPIGFGEIFNVYGKIHANSPVYVSGNIGMDTYKDNCGTLADVEALKESTGKKVSELMALYGPTINIYDGAELIATPSSTASDSSQGISLSGCAIVNVTGGTITGAEGVGMKGGVLNVSGGTITGTGAKCDPVQAVSSGTESSGAGISASTYYNANYPISINVTGGTVVSSNNAALLVAHSTKNGNPVTAVNGVTAEISGGTFIGGANENAVIIEAALAGEDGLYPEEFIEGGEFSTQLPQAYCADGYVPTTTANEQGYFTVTSEYDAQIVRNGAVVDGSRNLLANVAAAAQAGDTIQILRDVANAGALTLPAGATLETYPSRFALSGDVSITLDAAGGTVKNIDFTAALSRTTTGSKVIYAAPAAGAEFVIVDNTFSTTKIENHVLIEAATVTDFTATITGNSFNAGNGLKRAFAVVNAADAAKLTLDGNYIADGLFFGASANGANVSEKAYPQLATADAATAEKGIATFIVKKNATDGKPAIFGYDTLAEALTSSTTLAGDTILVTADTTLDAQVVATKDVTIDGQGNTLTTSGNWKLAGGATTANGVTTQHNVTLQNITLALADGDYATARLGGNVTLGANVTIDASAVTAEGALFGTGVTVAADATPTLKVGDSVAAGQTLISGLTLGANASVNVTGLPTGLYDAVADNALALRTQEATVTVGETTTYYNTLQDALSAVRAANADATLTLLDDVKLSGTETVSLNVAYSCVIDGNGHSITPAADAAYVYSRFDFGMSGQAYSAAKNYTVTNLTISGFSDSTYFIRAEGCSLTFADCTISNNTLAAQANSRVLLGTASDITLNGCTFANNTTASYMIDYNTNGSANGEPGTLSIDNCLFANNTCAGTGLIYTYGSANGGDLIANSTFTGNTVTSDAAAVIYFSGATDVEGCLFKNNTVTCTDATQKCGVLALGSGAKGSAVTGNVFVDNTLVSTGTKATVYAGAENANLGGNYWGDGEVPETGDGKDIYLAKSGVSYESYATSYALNAEGNGATVVTPAIAEAYDAEGGTLIGQYSTVNEAIAAVAAEGATYIKLLDSVTLTSPLTMTNSYTLDFNGKTIYYNTTKTTYIFRSSTITFKGGTLDISGAQMSNDGLNVFYFENGLSGSGGANGAYNNNVTFDGMTLYGDGWFAYSVFTLYAGGPNTLTFTNSTITLKNEANGRGGVFKVSSGTNNGPINIIDSTVTCTDVVRFSLYGTVNVKDSTVTFTGGENAFRQGIFTFDHSTVTVSGAKEGEGKGIVPRFSDTIVTNGSVLTFIGSNIGKDVLFEYANNIVIYDTSSVTAASVSGAAADRAIIAPVNYALVTTDNGGASVTYSITHAVARIEDTYYATFEDAVEAYQDGDTITVVGYDAGTMVPPNGWVFVTDNADVTTLVHALAQTITVNGATATTNQFASLEDAIAASATGDTVELLSNYTMTNALRFARKSVTLDLGGNTLKVTANQNNLAYGGVTTTITNGVIDISGVGASSTGVYIFDAGHSIVNGEGASSGNTINISDVTITGTDYYGYSVFGLYNNCALNIENSTVGLTNCLYTAGGFVKSDAAGYNVPITIKNSTIDLVNTQRIAVDGDIAIIDSTIRAVDDRTIAGDTVAKLDNGFNQSGLAITNSSVTISGGTGRGVTLKGKDIVVADGSTLAISNMAEGDIMFKTDNTVTATDNSTVTAGTVVLTSGTTALVNEILVADATSTVPTFTAQIGRVPYPTLLAAYNASVSGDTIQLIADDHSLTDGSELYITHSVTITGAVDANGEPLYTIYGSSSYVTYNDIFIKGTTGIDVTIENVKLANFGDQSSSSTTEVPGVIWVSAQTHADTHVTVSNVVVSSFNYAAIKMYNGTLDVIDSLIDCAKTTADATTKGLELGAAATASSVMPVVNVIRTEIINTTCDGYDTGAIEAWQNTKLTVDGCVITNAYFGIYACGSDFVTGDASGDSVSVTIKNTVIVADAAAVGISEEGGTKVPATVAIQSGTFVGGLGIDDEMAALGTIAVSGGNFDEPVPEEFCAPGYVPATETVEIGGVTYYTVKPGYYVAQVTFDEDGNVVTNKFETDENTTVAQALVNATAAADALYAAGTNSVVTIISIPDGTLPPAGWTFVDDGTTVTLQRTVAQNITVVDEDNITTNATYATVQAAIDAAAADDTIEVVRNVALPAGALTITKSITLTGAVDDEGKPVYTLTGLSDKTSADYADIYVSEDSAAVAVTISNLKLRGFGSAAAADGSSVVTFDAYEAGSTLTVTNLDIAAYNQYAVATLGDGTLAVQGCTIDGTTADATREMGGIYAAGAAVLTGGTITNVFAGVLAEGAAVAITNANIAADAAGAAVSSAAGAAVTIDGGEYAGGLDVEAGSTLTVESGRFDGYVDETNCGDGKIAVPWADRDGWYEVVPGAFVATITHGGTTTPYASLANAVAAAQGGDTIVMLEDVVLDTRVTVSGKSVTLALNEKSISGGGQYPILVMSDAVLTVTGSGAVSGTAAGILNYGGTVNIQGGTVSGQYGVYTRNGGTTTFSGGTVSGTVAGATAWGSDDSAHPTTVVVEDGATITGGSYGIAGNGSVIGAAVMVNGGTVSGTDAISTGIFFPGDGTVTIAGGTITGATGVEMRAGTLNVTSGTIIETASALSVVNNTSGSTVIGAAVAISQHTTEKPITVNISGGTLDATVGGVALFETDTVASATPSENVSAMVTGGIFYGAVTNDNDTISIPETSTALFSEQTETQGIPAGYTLVADETHTNPQLYKLAYDGIVYPTGGDSAGVPIPNGWLTANNITGTPTEIITALGQNGANGVPVWESYVLGLDPNVATSVVRLTGAAASGGNVTIEGVGINVPATLDANTIVTYHLEQCVPGGEWTRRAEAPATEGGKFVPRFTVPLSDVSGKMLRIVVDIVTAKAE